MVELLKTWLLALRIYVDQLTAKRRDELPLPTGASIDISNPPDGVTIVRSDTSIVLTYPYDDGSGE